VFSPAVRLVAMLVALTALSQFFRASTGAIGPELARDLSLTPEALAFVNASFFIALGLTQLPVGLAFDRWGPRRTATALTAVAVAGALLHTVADSTAMLALARGLAGFGMGAGFMGAVVLCARWFPGGSFATVLSWVFALSNLGTLAAATPLAWAAGTVGWRAAFLLAAVVTALVGALYWANVRDAPPGAPEAARPDRLADVLRGMWQVWRSPGLGPVFAMHLFVYASMITVLSLWAGPYLADVHGFGTLPRGHVLAAMAAAQVAGILAYGPLDRLFASRKKVVVGGTLLSIATLAPLALWPGLPAGTAVALLIAMCAASAYGVVIVAHGRSLFPAHLTGRGVTSLNMAQVIGSSLLPLLTGWVAAWAAAGAQPLPEAAYRWVFGTLAAGLALGLACYLRSRDVPP